MPTARQRQSWFSGFLPQSNAGGWSGVPMNSTPASSRAFWIALSVLIFALAKTPSSASIRLIVLIAILALTANTLPDHFMRYQTSLNNQLSKQIGELMELEKRYTK